VCSPSTSQMTASQNMAASNARCEYVSNGHVGAFQNTGGSFWVPFISRPILSILDVAPLNLVGSFMNDVHTGMS